MELKEIMAEKREENGKRNERNEGEIIKEMLGMAQKCSNNAEMNHQNVLTIKNVLATSTIFLLGT